MDITNSYNLIIGASIIIIFSFFFVEVSRKTNVPSVLMLIGLGVLIKIGLISSGQDGLDGLDNLLEVLGIIGLIMIVLEASLELELKREKLLPITKAFFIALIGLLLSTWIAAIIFQEFIPNMSTGSAWLYATPVSILSSAIIIPSVNNLRLDKKEFHIYESTFSDILGIMQFYFLTGKLENEGESGFGIPSFLGNLILTLIVSVVASYIIVFVFQHIRSSVKLFLLISVLLLLYAIGKNLHLSSLIIILVFGLMIANMDLFFQGRLSKWLHIEKAKNVYEGLHVLTLETAFVVRTFFFVIFGITISLNSLLDTHVAFISLLILSSIYAIRFVLLRLFVGYDIIPQLFVGPRGLITILLFYAIPKEAIVSNFDAGILLFIIIATSIVMTFSLVYDKRRSMTAIKSVKEQSVQNTKWISPKANE